VGRPVGAVEVGANVGRVGRAVGRLVGDVGETVGFTVGVSLAPVTNMAVKLAKLMLPRPVTGSQPVVALNPAAQQVGDDEVCEAQQLLVPEVISWNKFARAYNVGLINPTVLKPFF